uniref:Uncharacterized protein n=1 Tax=Anguilla anguilla TaxID=7936 RepID=A0A0E9RSV0_ANGAN
MSANAKRRIIASMKGTVLSQYTSAA